MSNKGRLVFILQKLLFRGRTEVGYLDRDPPDISFPSEIDAIDSFRHYLNSEKEKEKNHFTRLCCVITERWLVNKKTR